MNRMIKDYYSYESSRTHARFEGGGGGEATVGQAREGEEEEEMTTQHLGWAPCVHNFLFTHSGTCQERTINVSTGDGPAIMELLVQYCSWEQCVLFL
mmetsp:Transcript_34251/g.37018  ORF Transcript_34251/g.37018 Transcript_34251/m.37018 type:complete len:97 (-) Transcript_34251:1351-1641(-)